MKPGTRMGPCNTMSVDRLPQYDAQDDIRIRSISSDTSGFSEQVYNKTDYRNLYIFLCPRSKRGDLDLPLSISLSEKNLFCDKGGKAEAFVSFVHLYMVSLIKLKS